MTRQNLTNKLLAVLIRAQRVESITLCFSETYREWWLYISHADPELGVDLCTERGAQRRYKTADIPLHLLNHLGYQGPIKLDYLSAVEITEV